MKTASKTRPAKDQLVRLPDGTWVRPSTVTAIVPASGESCAVLRMNFPPRVIVHYGPGYITIINSATDADAVALADQIARSLRARRDAPKVTRQ